MTPEQTGFAPRVRRAIYQHFAENASAPSIKDLCDASQISARDIEESLTRLQSSHSIALAPGSMNIWMAPPFSAVPTAFSVFAGGRRYWANCAWDALGVASLMGIPSEISTHCADCGKPIKLNVGAEGLDDASTAVIHFLVPPKRFWENVGFT
jgi:hypothetical protein